jgi:hypothetical protein
MAMLEQVAQFQPQLVLVDGLDEQMAREHLADLAALAKKRQLPVWFTLRRPPDNSELDGWIAEYCTVGMRLVPQDRNVRIFLVRFPSGDSVALPLTLDPTTMLVLGEGEPDAAAAPLSPRPTDCTLYSGGANGAEAEFGAQSEVWGVSEVNLTFEGHNQARMRGRYELSPRELAAGDVSLVYVSRRLNRTYSEGSLIRRVLQTIWHMVSRSQQVFVIGAVQDDGTVKGGTGWSVELARMWNKNLWVFDQEKRGWYRWDGHEWANGAPVIESM